MEKYIFSRKSGIYFVFIFSSIIRIKSIPIEENPSGKPEGLQALSLTGKRNPGGNQQFPFLHTKNYTPKKG